MKYNLTEYHENRKPGAVLIYGPPGSGKTQSLSTLLKLLLPGWKPDDPPLMEVFDLDGKAYPLVREAMALKAPPECVTIYRYAPVQGDRIGKGVHRPRGQGKEVYLDFLTDFNGLYDGHDSKTGKWSESAKRKPQAIVIDSITTLQEIILDYILAEMNVELGDKKVDNRNPYGLQMGKLQEIVESAKPFPCWSIFTAHEKKVYGRGASDEQILEALEPKVTGQLSGDFAKQFVVCLHSKTAGSQGALRYVWETKPFGLIKGVQSTFTKDLPPEVDQDYKLVLKL